MHTRLARAEGSGVGSNFEFLRTHPVPERRIKVSTVALTRFRMDDERALLHSTWKNLSRKHTSYALPAQDAPALAHPSNNFLAG